MSYKSRRYREIVAVFAKHGFGLMRRFSSHDSAKEKAETFDIDPTIARGMASKGRRLRHALEELGPTFVKLGQLLSVRRDIFPADIIEELGKLQDSVPPFPFPEVKALIESELNDKLESIYAEFSQSPIAAASIAQVHRASLLSGKQVAVMVQRPEIEQSIHLDLEILVGMARWIDRHTKYGELYNFSGMVADFETTINNELDFIKEGENADTFRKNFSQDEGVFVPRVRWIYTTKRVLTMEYIEGIKISDNDALDQAGIDRKEVAERLSASLCNQILRDGFFHADPHPGNIQVLPDGTIVFLDLGMVGQLSEARKNAAADFFIGVVLRDSHMVVDAIVDMGAVTTQSNKKSFEKEVDTLIAAYLTMPMNQIRLDKLLHKVFQIAYSNHIKAPYEFALVAKALGMLQGLLEKMAPEINSLVIAEPIAKQLIYRSFSLKNTSSHIKKNLLAYRHLFSEIPAALRNILRKAEDESLNIKFEMNDMNMLQRRLERIFNRVSFSVILLAVSIIIAGVLISSGLSADMSAEMYTFNITVLKTGLALAVIIVLGLIISMFRSRR
jgi:ubiquinone biosynthesis protein